MKDYNSIIVIKVLISFPRLGTLYNIGFPKENS